MNFHASVFSPFCPSVTCVFSAVQLIVSVWNSGTSWRNWTGTESTMKMSADDLGNFSRMLDNANECNISPLVLYVQGSNQAPPDEPPSGPDLGNLFGLDAIQSGAERFESHVDVTQPASCVDTPFSKSRC